MPWLNGKSRSTWWPRQAGHATFNSNPGIRSLKLTKFQFKGVTRLSAVALARAGRAAQFRGDRGIREARPIPNSISPQSLSWTKSKRVQRAGAGMFTPRHKSISVVPWAGALNAQQPRRNYCHQKLQRASTRGRSLMQYRAAYDSIDELHDRYVEANSVHLDCGRKLLLVLLSKSRC